MGTPGDWARARRYSFSVARKRSKRYVFSIFSGLKGRRVNVPEAVSRRDNSDLQNLDHGLMPDPAGLAGLFTTKGYINDSRQFFVKVSYQFRF